MPETNLFQQYLDHQLAEHLNQRRIVVWYDPRREFMPYISDLRGGDDAESGTVISTLINGQKTHLCRYDGSFFAVRAAVEPLVAGDNPQPLLIYIPGIERDRHGSVLMELEKAGTCYEPQLRRLARNVLRQTHTDGDIDRMLAPAGMGYADIARFLRQQAGSRPSLLKALLGDLPGEALLTRWLAADDQDAAIVEKGALRELLTLIESRIGLPLPAATTIAEARDKTLRYSLVNEFRADLGGEPPASIAMIPEPPSGDHRHRIQEIGKRLRREHADRYAGLADRVELALGLGNAPLDAAKLGIIDTFRFEERRLLGYAGELIAGGQYDAALDVVTGRNRSFWVDRDVGRQAQWGACRLLAELGREIRRADAAIGKLADDPARWVAFYTADDGGFRVDQLQRNLEAWVAKMDEEPEAERALALIRRQHEELLKRMADGFSEALRAAGWSVPGVLHQTEVYSEIVQTMGGRVAYFLVDAMRYEMGVELARQLQGAENLGVRPVIAALPSITPVGMAALLPGAAASFAVQSRDGKLVASIDGTTMPGLNERLRFLKAQVPGVVEMTLGKLLQTTTAKLAKAIGAAPRIVVRSQEIDLIGEVDGDFLARQVMDTLIGNLARAVRKLARAGIESFVVTADHGHQFSLYKGEDMRTDSPGGDTLDLHRRCWIGHGGATPTGTVRVGGAELGYDTDLDFVFPTGLGVFKAGGSLSYHHGGFSLQELVIPVVTLRIPGQTADAGVGITVQLVGCPERITNRTFGVQLRVAGDLLATEPVPLRVILLAKDEQVGQTGMVLGAELDRATGMFQLKPGDEASVGLMLTRDDCTAIRIVAQDPPPTPCCANPTRYL